MLGGSVKHKPTTVRDRLGVLWGLLAISDDDYPAYMRSYGELFVDSPENTRSDYQNSALNWNCVGQKPVAAT